MTDTRLHGDLSVRSADDVAREIADDATLLVSGFGSVGYPKAAPLALADSGRDLSLTVVSGGSVREEIDMPTTVTPAYSMSSREASVNALVAY